MPAPALTFPPASPPPPPSTSSTTTTASTPSAQLCTLRVQVLSARNLAAKDRNRKSDPFVIVSLPGSAASNHQSSSSSSSSPHTRTTVKPKTLDPVWSPEEATFNFPVLPDWFGPNFAAVASDEIDSSVVRAALEHAVAARYHDHPESTPHSGSLTPDATGSGKLRPRLTNLRSASSKKLTGAASKLLVPVRLGAAGARVVGRQMPRPMRIRRRLNGSASHTQMQMQSNPSSASLAAADAKPPRGSIQLDASNGMVSSLEFVIWDKDRFSGNDYMGECSLLVAQWCRDGLASFDKAQSLWLPVESSRPAEKCTGELQVKIGFVPLNTSPAAATATAAAVPEAAQASGPRSWSVDEVYNRLVLASLGSQGAAVRAVPASQSVGTAPAEEHFVLDGLSSDSEDEMEDDDEEEGFSLSEGEPSDVSAAEDVHEFDTDDEAVYDQHYETVAGAGSSTAAASAAGGPVVSASQSSGMLAPPPSQPSGGKFQRMFLRNKSFKSSAQTSGAATPIEGNSSDVDASRTRRRLPLLRQSSSTSSAGGEGAGGGTPLRRPRRRRTANRGEFAFKAEMGQDIIGIVMMEVQGASDLPRWSNMTHTGFDMDPFAIISFGQKIFRTRVARHTLNPTWNEKLLFHVRRHETNFQAKFAIYDWDRVSSNDYVGGAQIGVAELVDAAPKPDPATGLYKADEEGAASLGNMHKFVLPLSRVEKDEEVKFKGTSKRPTLTIQAKFTPYDALRQRFWRQLALQFDTNDSGRLSRLELSSMLDSLGSTLSTKTLDGFFVDVGKEPEEDELTFEETIRALEKEVQKPWERKRKAAVAAVAAVGVGTGGSATPGEIVGRELNHEMDFTGIDAPAAVSADDASGSNGSVGGGGETKLVPPAAAPPATSSSSGVSGSSSGSSSTDVGSFGGQMRSLERDVSGLSMVSSTDSSCATPPVIQVEADTSRSPSAEAEVEAVEQVVRLQSCPLCHMPRLSKKGERDIITHLAVCASQDWRRVESLTVRNYVTATQAQRKWYTKVVNKISQGNYSLGANSANIIVQDRRTGELMEEKMQVYVRLGIRLLYQGARSRMEGARVKKMLKNMSVKQGVKFDSSQSVREIAPFIQFHNLDVGEIREPLESFRTFNEFFYRKLKPDARPNEEPENPKRLVSGADCRMMAFESVGEATRVWIKGREFSIARLVGDAVAELDNHNDKQQGGGGLERYERGGALAILRLAPQDYHRFHCPADAVVGKPYWIPGQYYTVNPMAIRSAIDVYGENIRVVVPFHSTHFGTFFAVCIGAMMVGSTVLTVKQGDSVKRGDEFGYFKFGGSTIVLVFQEGTVEWDTDLEENAQRAVETLVRVGMGVGRATTNNNQA